MDVYCVFVCTYVCEHLLLNEVTSDGQVCVLCIFLSLHSYMRIPQSSFVHAYSSVFIRTCVFLSLHSYMRIPQPSFVHAYSSAFIRTCIFLSLHSYMRIPQSSFVHAYSSVFIRTCVFLSLHSCMYTYFSHRVIITDPEIAKKWRTRIDPE